MNTPERRMERRTADEKVEIIYDFYEIDWTLRTARTAEDLENLKAMLGEAIATVDRLQKRITTTGETLEDMGGKQVTSKWDWR